MLKLGYSYVSSLEGEDVLVGPSNVLEAAVVGAEDEADLMKPKGFVILEEGASPCATTPAMLKAPMKERLARYKSSPWFVFVPGLPNTAAGKIQWFGGWEWDP